MRLFPLWNVVAGVLIHKKLGQTEIYDVDLLRLKVAVLEVFELNIVRVIGGLVVAHFLPGLLADRPGVITVRAGVLRCRGFELSLSSTFLARANGCIIDMLYVLDR
jgi:hypothetical protein